MQNVGTSQKLCVFASSRFDEIWKIFSEKKPKKLRRSFSTQKKIFSKCEAFRIRKITSNFWHPSSAPVGLANPTGMTVWICQSTPSMKDAEFFEPMFRRLDEYFAQLNPDEVTVEVEIVYFHSGSTKVLLDFFDKLVEEAKKGTQIVVNWIYEKEEKDMLQYGEQFQRDFKDLQINLVEKKLE